MAHKRSERKPLLKELDNIVGMVNLRSARHPSMRLEVVVIPAEVGGLLLCRPMTSAVAELSDCAFSPVRDLPYGYFTLLCKTEFLLHAWSRQLSWFLRH